MGIIEEMYEAMELCKEKNATVKTLMDLAIKEWDEYHSHQTLMKDAFNESFNELDLREKKLELVQGLVRKTIRRFDTWSLCLDQKMKKFDEKEKFVHGLLQRVEKELVQLGDLRVFVDENLKDVDLQEKRFVGLSEKLQAVRAELESRENVVGLEAKKLKKRKNKLDLKANKLETRDNVLVSREEKLQIRESEIDLREQNVNRRQHELDVKSKNLERMKNELDDRLCDLERKQSEVKDRLQDLGRKQIELDSKCKLLEEKKNEVETREENLEKRENVIESKAKDLDGKENKLNKIRKNIMDLKLNFDSFLDSSTLCETEPQAVSAIQTTETTQVSRKRFWNSALASRRNPDPDEENSSNLSKKKCVHDKEAEQVSGQDLGELGESKIDKIQVKAQPSSSQEVVALDASDSDSYSRDTLDSNLLNQFKVGDTWACLDAKKHLLRSYAQITKVINHGIPGKKFKLGVLWLKPFPEIPGEKEWVKSGLPVGCGMFNRGKTSLEYPSVFSHRVSCVQKEGSHCCIRPNEGETWAIYEDWNISTWASNKEYHRRCKYAIVEILLSQIDGSSTGFRVACLEKIEGHVKSYWRTSQNKNDSFLIWQNDFYRFSHQVISARIKGNVTDGVQDGTFEIESNFLPAGL